MKIRLKEAIKINSDVKKNYNLNLNLWMVSLLDVQLDFLAALPINFLPHDESSSVPYLLAFFKG
jgi:hypothetical protein